MEVTLLDGEWRKGGVARILICFPVQESNPGVHFIHVLGILGDGKLCLVGLGLCEAWNSLLLPPPSEPWTLSESCGQNVL